MRLRTTRPPRIRAATNSLCAAALVGMSCSELTGGGNGMRGRDLLWRVPLVGPDVGPSVPVADGARLYAVGRGISAYRAADGAHLYSTDRFAYYTPRNVVVSGGRTFAAESVAHAYDAGTGRKLWSFTPVTHAAIGAVAADDRAFYFGTGTTARRVYALDQATGRELWSTEVGPEWRFHGWVSGVAVSGDTLYIGAEEYRAHNGYMSSGWLAALDKTRGQILWRYSTGTGDEVRSVASKPVVAGRLVLASDYKGNAAFAVDRFTGREAWRREFDRPYVGPSDQPSVVDDIAYVGSGDTHVYALDLATGAVRWRTSLGGAIDFVAVCGNEVFAEYAIGLAVLDRHTGHVRWRGYDGDSDEHLTSGLATHGDRVYALGNKYAYAFRCH
jgi:outer membrane protein assembly factor BamB